MFSVFEQGPGAIIADNGLVGLNPTAVIVEPRDNSMKRTPCRAGKKKAAVHENGGFFAGLEVDASARTSGT
jgi:hypothetical protein